MTMQMHKILAFEGLLEFNTYLISVLMFSPDLIMTGFVYTPIFIVARITQLVIRYDMKDKDNVLWYGEELAMMTVTTNMLFYIYHTMELDFFF